MFINVPIAFYFIVYLRQFNALYIALSSAPLNQTSIVLVSLFLAATDDSSNTRIACSRRSDSGGGAQSSEHENKKTARELWVEKRGINPPLSLFVSSAFFPPLVHDEV